jgi:hypothetical protein
MEEAMRIVTVLVCTVDVAPGLHIGAVWDGGKTIALHIDRDGQTTSLARWPIWNEAWDCPLIEPTRESFTRFVEARLVEPGAVEELLPEKRQCG